MPRRSFGFTLLLVVLPFYLSGASPAPAPGRLVIVGGALAADNDAVHAAFLAAADAAGAERPIYIVPAASGYPSESAGNFRQQLLRRGADAARVRILPLALMDDPTTPELDESTWAQNGADSDLAAEAATAGAFWFVGGDQSRIAAVLLAADGTDLPVLRALRAAHARGAALGGTSAGAAIMSDPMILGGDSLGALRLGVSRAYAGMDDQESGPLVLGRGLGFFPFGLVDQHFDRKARHARLIVALAGSPLHRGYGIDEDTALVVDLATGTAEVAGRANVTFFDTSDASFSVHPAPFAARDIRLSVLSPGDRLDLRQGIVTPSTKRQPTAGRESFNLPSPVLGAALVPYSLFRDLAGPWLVDNRAADTASALAFAPSGEGWRLVLQKNSDTAGYEGGGHLTVINARLSLEPVTVTVTAR